MLFQRLFSLIYYGNESSPNSHYEKFILTGEVKCIDDEIPFELPNGWEWCRLGEVAEYRKGPFGSSLTKSMFVPFSSSSIKVYEQKNAIQKDFSLGEYYITEEKFNVMSAFRVLPNDIIVSCAGTIGETYILPMNAPIGIINQALMRVSLFEQDMSEYWRCLFEYVMVRDSLMKGSGSAIKNIPPFEYLKNILIPLPPLSEQQRIVAKIEELMPLVEQYSKAQSELEVLNTNIREQLKKSILQYAIEGKLVPQCEEDGTAEDLLQEIQAEKQRLYAEGKLKKKDLTRSTIFRGEDNKYYEQIGKEVVDITEEIPYELPNGWSFCRLSVLCWLDDGSKHFDEVLPYLDAKYQRGNSLPTYIQEGRLIEAQSKVILVDGENSGEVFITQERGYLGSTFKLLQSMPQVSATWIQYVLENYRPLLKGSKVGAAIPHLNKKLFHNLIIGLPCRKEQEFIAKQLDSLFQLIEG